MSNVDHPAHYGGAENIYEVIKVMEAWLTPEEFAGALKFNIHKYLARAKMKGGAEDVAKAAWYAARLAEFESKTGTSRLTKIDAAMAKRLQTLIEENGRLQAIIKAKALEATSIKPDDIEF